MHPPLHLGVVAFEKDPPGHPRLKSPTFEEFSNLMVSQTPILFYLFFLVLMFNGISYSYGRTAVVLFNPEAGRMGGHTIFKVISPKGNIISRLEFELTDL